MKNIEISHSISNYEIYLKNNYHNCCSFCNSNTIYTLSVELSIKDNVILIFRYCDSCYKRIALSNDYITICSFKDVPSVNDFNNQFEKSFEKLKKTLLLI